jgi:hypothetical protein
MANGRKRMLTEAYNRGMGTGFDAAVMVAKLYPTEVADPERLSPDEYRAVVTASEGIVNLINAIRDSVMKGGGNG